MNNTTTASVRFYAEQDYQPCLGIFDSNVPRYFASTERNEFEQFLLMPNADFLVAEREGFVIGCGGCYVREAVGRLCWGMVHNASHRSSAGSALLAWRLDRLFLAHGVMQTRLDTSQLSAPFFSRFGFLVEHVDQDGFAPGIDCVSMYLSREAWLSRANETSASADAA
jgi:N-acetylglutamate synthase-like GNAT family acetyltransferase